MNKDKNKNKGFTLIELLVVILIIGILGSIAFTQYQKSILKSRFSTLVPIAKALNDGQEMFLLSHGKYADKLENLDVEIAANASGNTANINGKIITLGANNRHTYVKATREDFDNNLIMFQNESRYFPGEIHCEAKEGKTLANWLCKNELGGIKLDRSLTEGYTDYVIKGDGNGFFPKDWVNVRPDNIFGSEKLVLMPGDTCTANDPAGKGCNAIQITNGKCYGNKDEGCSRSNYTDDSLCQGNTMYGCFASSFTNNSLCEGSFMKACYGSKFIDSICQGDKQESCYASTFTNSQCSGADKLACAGSNFKERSTCEGSGGFACSISTYTEDSSCIGNSSTACTGSTFQDNSICYANEDGACGVSNYDTPSGTIVTPATYEGNACCKGDFCPASAPKCDCGIDSSTGQHSLSC